MSKFKKNRRPVRIVYGHQKCKSLVKDKFHIVKSIVDFYNKKVISEGVKIQFMVSQGQSSLAT